MNTLETKEIKAIIGNNPPFNRLRERSLRRFFKIYQLREYKSGEVIYKEKDRPDYLYILLKGRVMASAKAGAEDHDIEILKRGTVFGIISLLTDDPHSVTTRAIEDSFILQVEKDKFRRFLEDNPALSLDFSRILSQRVKVRFRPKKVFQSKRIAVIGEKSVGKTDYAFNLSNKLKEQTAKAVIYIQVLPAKDTSGINQKAVCPFAQAGKIIALKDFSEEKISDYLVRGKVDYLCVASGDISNFTTLLNLISESYHFVIYEIPQSLLKSSPGLLTLPAHQVHFISFGDKQNLKEAAVLLRQLTIDDPLGHERVKLILTEFKESSDLTLIKKRKLLDYPIYATLPDSQSEDYSKALRRIARQIGEVTVGLALGSGAAYGFSHIGVLEVLEENDIPIDIICGSSMGALIASLWAAGFKIKDIERLANEFGKKISKFSLIGFSFPFKGLMRGRRLESIFKGIFKDLTFYDLKHTLKIVAFDFLKRQTVILEEGLLYKAVAASCAFPGIFEPINFKKDILLDGGILNPLPTKILLNFDTHKIIASDITLSSEEVIRECRRKGRFHIFDFIFGSIETMQREFIQQAAKIADVVIHPRLEGLGWMEFNKISEFIVRGRVAARKKVDEIKELLKA